MTDEQQMPEQTVNKDARTFAMLCHLLGVISSIVGPLIIWLLKREEHAFVDDQGKEALNWQITVAIGYVLSVALSWLLCIGALLGMAVTVVNVVFCIMGALKANEGVAYRYPVCLRFIK